MGLKHALSAKMKEGKFFVVEDFKAESLKTKELFQRLEEHNWESALFIDGEDMNVNFRLAMRNIPGYDMLPQIGANVYDILKKEVVVMSVPAVQQLESRLQD
jgi:large subunit ribosomal protein L4